VTSSVVEGRALTVVKMPSGEELDVPDSLLRDAHPATTAANKPLILHPSVTFYNHSEKTRTGYQYDVKEIGKVEANFTGRPVKYQTERLKSVMNALYGGTNLPPVEVRKTGSFPPYTLTDGFHRYIASAIAGFPEIPCFIVNEADPQAPVQPKSINPLKRPAPDETEEEAKARRRARFGAA
jgi:hypothetical protein